VWVMNKNMLLLKLYMFPQCEATGSYLWAVM